MARHWTAADVPDLHGRTAVITGGNTGLGFQTAQVLAVRGATVVLACRDPQRAAAAATQIGDTPLRRTVDIVHVDLASQASVREAAGRLRARHPRIDLLINNAGALMPRRSTSEDGFDLTLATNHLGPFAFTGLLLGAMLAVPDARVVTVSSIGHRYGAGTINFDDLHFSDAPEPRGPDRPAYFQSKLANLLFTYELQRRLTAAGAGTIAVAAHPGNARTEFGRALSPVARALMSPRARPLTWWLMQSPEVAALAVLRAATDPEARGGDFFGPPGRFQFTGHPVKVDSSAASHDEAAQRRLWAESERLTGVTFPIPAQLQRSG
ncbi:oxidoreductase [Actinoplanes sp. NBC_00393]|uniref:oxidoreductase n=1 Tax=Actinoplanes sp. NBC_00393 TaxID=2975953 RepID=UPI002E204967